jgi:hypothetical protein
LNTEEKQSKIHKGAVFVTLLTLIISQTSSAIGGLIDPRWSEVIKLSSPGNNSSPASLVADVYGTVHAFWSEVDLTTTRSFLMYSQFNGNQWTPAIDIYVTNQGGEIRYPSAILDAQGNLQVYWTGSLYGPIWRMIAPLTTAMRVRSWSKPSIINYPAKEVIALTKASASLVYLVFLKDNNDGSGVYTLTSEDGGNTWSPILLLDPLKPDPFHPIDLEAKIDKTGHVHLVWWYGEYLGDATIGRQILYTSSSNDGKTWKPVSVLDEAGELGSTLLTFPSPRIAASGDKILVIWGKGQVPYRYFAFSIDGGQTWTNPNPITQFEELHGQAFDTLIVDSQGTFHFIGQIRFPQGIYHAMWRDYVWSKPTMFYEIDLDSPTLGSPENVHAHRISGTVLKGNTIVITFTDSPSDPPSALYSSYRIFKEVPAIQPLSSPLILSTPVLTLTPNLPQVNLTGTPTFIPSTAITSSTASDSYILMGSTLLSLVLVCVLLVVHRVIKRS